MNSLRPFVTANNERDEAIKLAKKILDDHHIHDPDGDLSVLSRQFLREIERNSAMARMIESPF